MLNQLFLRINRIIVIAVCSILLIAIRGSARVDAQAFEDGPETLDIIIVMDNSDSNRSTDEQNLREHFTRALFHLFAADADFTPSRIGVIFFGTNAELWNGRMFDATELELPLIEFPGAEGYTIIDQPLKLAYQTLSENGSYDGRHASAVIFLTDGRPEYDDGKPGPQGGEVTELFRRSEPWVNLLAENGTRLYIVSYAGGVTLQEERWAEFAEMTGGAYDEVDTLQEATSLYVTVVANALLGYNPQEVLPPTKMSPFEPVEREIDVYPATNRILLVALRLDPGTEVQLYRPDGTAVGDADADIVVRGGEIDSKDKVWRVDFPEEGKWKLVFRGGTSLVQAWYFFRPFDINLLQPSSSVLQPPGQPFTISTQLEDHIARQTVTGEISDLYPVKMILKVTEPLPSGVTGNPIDMNYVSKTGIFSTDYIPENTGKYVLQFLLTVGNITLAKHEYNLYVGYTPEISSIEIQEASSNDVTGFQIGEQLQLHANIVGSENATVPGYMRFQALIQSPGGEEYTFYNDDFALAGIADNMYLLALPEFDDEGIYSATVWLSGSTSTGVEFGAGREIQRKVEFKVEPYPLPRLLDVSVVEPSYWFTPVDLRIGVKRYHESQSPSLFIEIYSDQNELVESTYLSTANAQIEQDLLRYSWYSQAMRQLGNYTARVSLQDSDEAIREIPIKIVVSPQQQFGFIALIILGLGGLVGLVVWLRTRPLAPVVVVGYLEFLSPRQERERGERIRLSQFGKRAVTIGRGGDISLDDDPEIIGLVAKLVGRVGEDRRTQIPPVIYSLRRKGASGDEIVVKMNFNTLGASDRYRRPLHDSPNGIEILIGERYHLLYKYDDRGERRAHNA